jgi:RNA polymerase sigma factor (sigma-70 family)
MSFSVAVEENGLAFAVWEVHTLRPTCRSPDVSPPSNAPAPAPAGTIEPDATRWFTDEVHPLDASLKAYLRGSFPAVRDVDDVVQESYLRIWRARAREPIQSAKAFLFKVARGVALNFLRKNRNAPFEPLGDFAAERVLDHGLTVRETATVQERIDLLADALMALPPRCREIILLHKVEGLPQKEVAARLGVAERTVESQVRIGVKKCFEYLQRRGWKNYRGDET